LVEARRIVIRKVKEVEDVTLAKHVRATAKSLFGERKTGSRNMQLFYSQFDVGGETFVHEHEGESGHFILSGKLQLITHEDELIVETDTSVFIPPKIEHRFKNIGETKAVMLSIFSPPEQMFEMDKDLFGFYGTFSRT